MNGLHSDFLDTPSEPLSDWSPDPRQHRASQSLGQSPSWLLSSNACGTPQNEALGLDSVRYRSPTAYLVDQRDQQAGKSYGSERDDQSRQMFGTQHPVVAEHGDWQHLSGHRRTESSSSVQEPLVHVSFEKPRSNEKFGLKYVSTSPAHQHLQNRSLGGSTYDQIRLLHADRSYLACSLDGVSQMRLDEAEHNLKPTSDSPECRTTTMTGELPSGITSPLVLPTKMLVANRTSARSKPTSSDASHQATKSKNECELCGAKSSLLTILFPCCHRACSICMSSGLSQVSTSPPRDHTCAACGTYVNDIGIDKSGLHLSNWANRVTSSPPIVAEDGSPSGSQVTVSSENGPKDPSSVHSGLSAPNESNGSARLVGDGGTLATDSILRSSNNGQVPRDLAAQYNVKGIESVVLEMKLVPQQLHETLASIEDEDDKLEEEECTLATLSVVRVDNIPWTTTVSIVQAWLPPNKLRILPPSDLIVQPIHIPIDVVNGKTSNACFIECANRRAAMRLIRARNNSRLCGRPVSLLHSKPLELTNQVFPSRSTTAALPDPGLMQLNGQSSPRYFTAKQLHQLVNLFRNGSPQLKNSAMPIEYLTSMLCLLPLHLHLSVDQASALTLAVQRKCIPLLNQKNPSR